MKLAKASASFRGYIYQRVQMDICASVAQQMLLLQALQTIKNTAAKSAF
jgi:hypothetical protein